MADGSMIVDNISHDFRRIMIDAAKESGIDEYQLLRFIASFNRHYKDEYKFLIRKVGAYV
jgi:hypothetical protein